ncbi:MAG: RluA family pseudouridine synthase [Verrucomicrobia bacterium]|nr:RluA family pseudouridine synthase [Verrucomicrobiota bacterium]
MAKPDYIELGDGERIPILYEDRSVLVIDKPAGWMLIPHSWQKTDRNLQAAIQSSLAGGAFWARARNLRFLRHVHRLDAETSGLLMFAKSRGGVDTFGDLFERRQIEKVYLAVARGVPQRKNWVCRSRLAPEPNTPGRMRIDERHGKPAETAFRVLQQRQDAAGGSLTLLEARPVTGRTHQIRVHLAGAGLPVVGDELYGGLDPAGRGTGPTAARLAPGSTHLGLLGLRAVGLSYTDPFTRRRVQIQAPAGGFLQAHGFAAAAWPANACK